jgi:hypothetical protein
MNLRILSSLFFAAALLAGCEAPAPTSPMERGIESKHPLKREPHLAAACIARNIDENRKALKARILPGRDPILTQVEVSASHVVALAQLLISGDGSTAAIWTTPELAQPREELVAVMIQGC